MSDISEFVTQLLNKTMLPVANFSSYSFFKAYGCLPSAILNDKSYQHNDN